MDKLRQLAQERGIFLADQMLDQLSRYEALLLDWNTRMNLTAITEHADVVTKHFLDSLLLLCAVELPQGASVIDVGTGAGFPGIPLKIARPDLRLTLLDSLQKRMRFLQTVCDTLHLEAVQCIHSRAEDAARLPEFREKFDLGCARAVAALPSLAEYGLPFVRVGGCFVAMKGAQGQEELQDAACAIGCLGGGTVRSVQESLPGGDCRWLFCIEKRSQTPAKYPRKGIKIQKFPLMEKK